MNIIGIDCGKGGAIAWSDGIQIRTMKMPETNIALFNFLKSICTPDAKVYIEYQHMRVGDEVGGKMFSRVKLIINYEKILFALEIIGAKIEIITPQKWQKKYTLPVDYSKKKSALNQIAKERFPRAKPTLATCDALLIMEHGRIMASYEKK